MVAFGRPIMYIRGTWLNGESFLEQILAAKEDSEEDAEDYGGAHDDVEGKGEALQIVGDVHAIEAGDERWQHEDNVDAGERLHGAIDVVGDDRGVGVGHIVDDVAVDAGGLLGLFELNFNIFGQFFIAGFAEYFGMYQAIEEDIVAFEGCYEIDQTVLDALEFENFVVAHRLLEFGLAAHHLHIDVFEVLKEPNGGREHESHGQFVVVGDGYFFADGVDHKVVQHIGLVVADGNADIVLDKDTKRDGGEVNTAIVSTDGDAKYNKLPIVVLVTTWSLVGILNIVQEIFGHFETRDKEVAFFGSRALEAGPAVGFPFIGDLVAPIVDVKVHHGRKPRFKEMF